MKVPVLTILLLTVPAAAQTAPLQPGTAQPNPVQTPALPTPVKPVPVLRLSAPAGASVAFSTTTTSRIRLSGVTVTALPGAAMPVATLERIRRDLSANLGRAGQTLTLSGRVFVRVAARAADGTATLISTVVQGLPGEPPVTLRFMQDVAPTGEVRRLRFESDSAPLNAVYGPLPSNQLTPFARENGQALEDVYGRPLSRGQTQTENLTLDAPSLLSSVLGAIASEENADELFAQAEATPLRVVSTSTSQGLNAQGLHEFRLGSTAGEWQITAGSQGTLATVTATLNRLESSGTQLYRQDGLPGASTRTLNLALTLTMAMDGVQIGLEMTLEQRTATTPR